MTCAAFFFFSLLFILVLLISKTSNSFVKFSSLHGPRNPFTYDSYPSPRKVPSSHDLDIQILPSPYYTNVPPRVSKDGGPVPVDIGIELIKVTTDLKAPTTVDLDLYYYAHWNDDRLLPPSHEASIAQYIHLSYHERIAQYKLNGAWQNRLWTPDTIFANALFGNRLDIHSPTNYFVITNYTEIFMTVRLHLKLFCDMNFARFPFDKQTCFLNITTTFSKNNTIRLGWDRFTAQLEAGSEFKKLTVEKVPEEKLHCLGKNTPCLSGRIVLQRNAGRYLLKSILPSTFIVLMTFIGFCLPTSFRTSLLITALVALITHQRSSELPFTAFNALQLWNISCIIVVFANFIQMIVSVNVLFTRAHVKKSDILKMRGISKWIHLRSKSSYSGLDFLARYLFPGLFLLYTIAFTLFCVYM